MAHVMNRAKDTKEGPGSADRKREIIAIFT